MWKDFITLVTTLTMAASQPVFQTSRFRILFLSRSLLVVWHEAFRVHRRIVSTHEAFRGHRRIVSTHPSPTRRIDRCLSRGNQEFDLELDLELDLDPPPCIHLDHQPHPTLDTRRLLPASPPPSPSRPPPHRRQIANMVIEDSCRSPESDCSWRGPLTWACRNGHVDVVKVLLEGKAEVDGSAINGANEVDGSAINGANESVGSFWSPLSLSCREGHAEVVRVLLEGNARLDTRCPNRDGYEPLGWAAEGGHSKAMEAGLLHLEGDVCIHRNLDLDLDLEKREVVLPRGSRGDASLAAEVTAVLRRSFCPYSRSWSSTSFPRLRILIQIPYPYSHPHRNSYQGPCSLTRGVD